MDAYLDIASRVLREARRPLPPREILRRGLSSGIVPPSLYGKTQHKTLQARLSEDILSRRERSAFFRTRPGYFFLREFLTDPAIPAEYRVPIVARRRRRELAYHHALALNSNSASELCRRTVVASSEVLQLLSERHYHYASSSRRRTPDDVLVWSFVLVLRSNHVLTYRHGRYREDRDNFLQKRSVGFFCPVVHDDLTLFDQEDHGIVASGLRAVSVDLSLSTDLQLSRGAELKGFICANNDNPLNLLGVVAFQAPEWLEPITRRLAINDLAWHDLKFQINHYEDFDPWSRLVLENLTGLLGHEAQSCHAAASAY
ncbi:winged helix-turn-helix domain-containing protein [Bradyrhizobium sp. CCGUVB23]|uniref:winged helix-turn-helix domain-containing protein n=1 Tax=Bradyrhizobium sp. CCGUVB23 TaxID=2949630 RepID=UPI0020B34FC7|nr:winged helix-turn-helix domain-containing protein [Bradyrhizobium sp. CCGUVB23]MCP3460722.1 winged helix-turn-helix domain-containing protein [Bradyrhizobium sp. CCGUVB23]